MPSSSPPLHCWRWSPRLHRVIRRRRIGACQQHHHEWILHIPGAEEKLAAELNRRLMDEDRSSFPWIPGADSCLKEMLELKRRGIAQDTSVCLMTSPARVRMTARGVRLFGTLLVSVCVGGFVVARVEARLPVAKFAWKKGLLLVA